MFSGLNLSFLLLLVRFYIYIHTYMLHIKFSRMQILKWKFVNRKVLGVNTCGGREESRTGQGEKLGWEAVSTNVSDKPERILKLGHLFRIVPSWGDGNRLLYPTSTSHWMKGGWVKGACPWVRQLFSAKVIPKAERVSPLVQKGNLGGAISFPLL